MEWHDGISGPHREIAESTHMRIGVLAGPGTGKTSYGLMRRVVRLLGEGHPGERILLLSFTRVAAADLRDKIAVLDVPGVEDIRATTLHSFCFGLLQQDAVLAITGRTPRILLEHETDLMLRDIGGNFGDIHARRRLLEAFVAGWARGIEDHPGTSGVLEDRQFEHEVMRWLREHRAMLIGEVIPEAHRYLTTNPTAEALHSFDHVIVDEYQDLNVLEQGLLEQLASNTSLCIAGDDDQSIYSVRYAHPEGILSFIARNEVESHVITVCGRCPANILSMANALIGQAPHRDKEDLVALDTAAPGAVAIVQWPDVDSEIEGVISAIAGDIGSSRREPGQVLVLTNWRRIGERVRARLNELGIPARSFFSEEELNSTEAKEALAMLRLVVDEADAPALRVLLGLGDATGRTEAYQRLLKYCREHATRPFDVLGRLTRGEKIGLTVRALVERYRSVMARVEQLRSLELPELVDALFPDGQEHTADLRAVAVDSIADAADQSALLRDVIEAVTQDTVPQDPDFVRVMSLHKSKGLTSPVVYIVGAVHGVIPTVRNEDPEAVLAATNEGRRLFYVAITRAAEELVVSGSASMDLADANSRGVKFDSKTIRKTSDGWTVRTIASPYIAELGSSRPKSVTGQEWLQGR